MKILDCLERTARNHLTKLKDMGRENSYRER